MIFLSHLIKDPYRKLDCYQFRNGKSLKKNRYLSYRTIVQRLIDLTISLMLSAGPAQGEGHRHRGSWPYQGTRTFLIF